MRYKIKTPNFLYSGTTEGVPFTQGVGYTDDKNIRNVLVNDYGYQDVTDYESLQETAKEVGDSTKESIQKASEAQETLSDTSDLENLKVTELKDIARELKLTGYSELPKVELIELIRNAQNEDS